MPFRDRTGPLGFGPRTGRVMGFCTDFPSPSSENPSSGRGWSRFGRTGGSSLFGRGRGWRCQYWKTGLPGWIREGYGYPLYEPGFTAKDEINVLQDQADFLKRQLEDIQNRINTLEKAQKQES